MNSLALHRRDFLATLGVLAGAAAMTVTGNQAFRDIDAPSLRRRLKIKGE